MTNKGEQVFAFFFYMKTALHLTCLHIVVVEDGGKESSLKSRHFLRK